MKSLSLTKPHMIVMVGAPGSGKSFFAEKFAEMFHAPYVSNERLSRFIQQGDSNAACLDQLTELLKTQASIIFDGAASTHTERTELAKQAHGSGYEILFVWVQTDTSTAKARALHAAKGSSTKTPSTYEQEVKRFTPPTKLEKPLVISGKHTFATQARVVLKKLSSPRAEVSSQTSTPSRVPPARRNITIR